MATIKDVSRQAQVSIKTVSRVMNGSPEVAEATRKRVLKTIEELDYRPSALGQRLVSGKTGTIGVVIPRTAGYVFGHPYFHEVLRGIGDVLGRNALDLLLHLGRDDGDYALLVHQRKVDGLILLSIPIGDQRATSVLTGPVAAVFTCRATLDDQTVNWVDCDPFGGMDEAVDHLVSLGHGDIGFLQGPQQLMLPRLQLQALRASLAGHGIALRDEWVLSGDYSSEAGSAHVRRLLERPRRPTALICGDDMIAIGAVSALTGAGLVVPRDCSVIGFDDVVISRYLSPSLTTIRQDAYGKGQRAAQMLIDAIARGPSTVGVHQMLPTKLIVRSSTAAPRQRGGPSMA